MRGVATSDLHLTYRAYSAMKHGRNAREQDVEAALERVADNIIAADPDLITIAGDVFHHPRPSNHALKAWRDFALRLTSETEAWVVTVLGNHDAGRTAETLSPVHIPDDIERFIVVAEPTRLQLDMKRTGEKVAVACLPFVARGTGEAFRVTPDQAADVNVLLIHAPLAGAGLPRFYAGADSLDVTGLAKAFDVVAAGDYHEFQRLHPDRLAFYSGSIERTSSNIWPETTPKGVVVYQAGPSEPNEEMRFVTHDTRAVRDEHWGPPTATAVNQALEVALEEDLQGVIFRAVVAEFPRHERDQIRWDLVRALKHSCLQFYFDIRWASRSAATRPASPQETGRPLLARATDFLADDPEPVRELALRYLGAEEPAEREQPAAPAEAVA